MNNLIIFIGSITSEQWSGIRVLLFLLTWVVGSSLPIFDKHPKPIVLWHVIVSLLPALFALNEILWFISLTMLVLYSCYIGSYFIVVKLWERKSIQNILNCPVFRRK